MKILNANAGMLTDFEVLDFLRARGAKSDPMGCLGVVTNSECKVYDYLVQRTVCNQTREGIEDFKRRCEVFMKEHGKGKLTKAEILNIINLRPSSQPELYAIIPDLDKRFKISEDGSSDIADGLLSIVHDVFPPPLERPEQEEPDQEEAQDAEEMEQNQSCA